IFTPFLVTARTNSNGQPLDSVVPSVCTGQHHAIIQPSAIVRLVGDRPVHPLDAPNATQTTGADHNLLVSRARFLVQSYGREASASPIDAAVPTQTPLPRHALVSG